MCTDSKPLSKHELWHKHITHFSRKGLSQIHDGLVSKINFCNDNKNVCVTCLEDKQTVKDVLL